MVHKSRKCFRLTSSLLSATITTNQGTALAQLTMYSYSYEHTTY